jgi:hypothetical protein
MKTREALSTMALGALAAAMIVLLFVVLPWALKLLV